MSRTDSASFIVNNSSDEILDEPKLVQNMIDFIVKQRDVFFKSQQIDEDVFSFDEKSSIVKNLYISNKCVFLQRYGKYLDQYHLNCLQLIFTSDEYEAMLSLIQDLQKRLKHNIRNRRFKVMQDMIINGTYFSESEMQNRNPYLFEQMVGQYMNDTERKQLQQSNYQINYDSANFSSFLLEQIRNIHLQCKYIVEEQNNENDSYEEFAPRNSDNPNSVEIIELKKEFTKQMLQDFLNGKDTEFFDYDKVDYDADFDMSKEYERDQEDLYFKDDD